MNPRVINKSIATILDKCLAVRSDDPFLVIYDESFASYFETLQSNIIERELTAAFIFIPSNYQVFLCNRIDSDPDTAWLPHPIAQAISSAHAILNVLDGNLQTLGVRKALLNVTRAKECRLAHVPGISEKILDLVATSPFDEILESSEITAWALGQTFDCKLLTSDFAGKHYQLHLNLGGWLNEPLMSPGLLLPGSWGNLPPGETFCCPDPDLVDGIVCVNGSVPGHVMTEGEEVLLEFERGRLIKWSSSSPNMAVKFFDDAAARANAIHDKDWNVFAELGIGLNPAIVKLSGNSLFDEKAAGTVHVAIGENTQFGHRNRSALHADLAILRPTLLLDDEPLLDRGKLCLDKISQIRDSWVPPPNQIGVHQRVKLNTSEYEEQGNLLYRRLCKAHRIGLVRMGSVPLCGALCNLNRKLFDRGEISVREILENYPTIDGFETGLLLGVLYHYGCLTVL